MKLIPSCVISFFFAAAGFAADAAIEFRGVMTGDGSPKLSLTDKTTDTTRWVEPGQVFLGYTVKGYDAEKETATLTKEGKEYRIRLNTSKIEEANYIGPAATKAPGEITRAVLNNLRQISAAADQYMLETGKNTVRVADLVGPEKYIKQLTPVDGENYGALARTDSQQALSVTTQSGTTITYDPSLGIAGPTAIVGAGETATTLAKRYGINIDQLRELNPNVDFARLKIGQPLRVP